MKQKTLGIISATCQVRILSPYTESFWRPCAIDEFGVPAFIGPDEMGYGVDDIDTMFD
jgi:hypothetical protein